MTLELWISNFLKLKDPQTYIFIRCWAVFVPFYSVFFFPPECCFLSFLLYFANLKFRALSWKEKRNMTYRACQPQLRTPGRCNKGAGECTKAGCPSKCSGIHRAVGKPHPVKSVLRCRLASVKWLPVLSVTLKTAFMRSFILLLYIIPRPVLDL